MESQIKNQDERVLEMLSKSIKEIKDINKIVIELKGELRKKSDISACNAVLRYLSSVGIEEKGEKIYENLVSIYYDIEGKNEGKKGGSSVKNF